MEIVKDGIASGSISDLPPSKRFKYVNSQPGSTPCLPLPAKKRVFPPPPPQEAEAEAEAVAVPICLPAKKRAIVAPPPEDAVPLCLPAKKRAYPQPADAIIPASCLPAKKRVYAAPSADMVASPCVPAKKRVCAAPPADMVSTTCVPAKKGVHAPPHREGSIRSRPVCLPSNKRVMPPFVPSPSVGSDGVRVAAVKGARPQGSNKHSGATNPRVANGAEDCARGKNFKEPEKPTNPREIKEQVSVKPRKPRSPNKAKDLDKKACKVVNGNQPEVGVEVRKKADKAADAKGAARKGESRNGADEEARVPEHEVVEEEYDGVLCAVCGSTDGDPSDPIVFCDGCDLMVHASCYGNPLAQAIPDGDWFCSLCSAKKSKSAARPSCCLCPARGGAMKRTTDGRLAHISCALLVPEVFFRDPDGRDGIDCSRVPAHRFTKECYICDSSSGCALECSQPKCNLGFHVSCGLDGGLCIEYREGKGGAIVAGFCREHTELWEKQQLTGKYKIVARGQE